MATVVVTGASGTLGSRLVPALTRRNHHVRAISRGHRSDREGVTWFRADVRTGAGVATAVEGSDAVIHAATSPYRRVRATEVDGTEHIARGAAAAGVGHVVYVSIVGVDRISLGYYKAKVAAERIVQRGDVPWSVLRATQFHDQVARYMRAPLFPATKHLAFQPLDANQLAERLVDLVESGPAGRVTEIAGPEVLGVRQLGELHAQVTGRRPRFLPVPPVAMFAQLDAGHHLAPHAATGDVTYERWLREQTA